MVAVTNATRFGKSKNTLIDLWCPGLLGQALLECSRSLTRFCVFGRNERQLRGERFLHLLGVGCGQLVLCHQPLLRPQRGLISRTEPPGGGGKLCSAVARVLAPSLPRWPKTLAPQNNSPRRRNGRDWPNFPFYFLGCGYKEGAETPGSPQINSTDSEQLPEQSYCLPCPPSLFPAACNGFAGRAAVLLSADDDRGDVFPSAGFFQR